jgi:CRP-like cAMP-binding protein
MEIGPRSEGLALFVRKIEARSAISAEERAELLALPAAVQIVDAHRDFVRGGENFPYSYLIVSGVVARFAQLADGSRQTIGFHLPGDIADLYALMLPRAQSPLQALTRCTILTVPHYALMMLSAQHPNIAAALWRDCVADGQLVAQWLVNVGRRNARARTAHLLCELATRYDHIGLLEGGSFPFAVTQEQLADALGLTSVHVNRTLKTLRESGLIRFEQREAIILDWVGLMNAAGFNPKYLSFPHLASSSSQRAMLA